MAERNIVLVVDDDPSVLAGIGRLLRAHGLDTELFLSIDDFRSCVSVCDAHCLVLDIDVNGKSGLQLKRELTDEGVSLPVIFITASDSESFREHARQIGCVAYLQKPFPAESLMSAIQCAVQGDARAKQNL